ncbi:winged helix-turn-helix domain-containing protein [Serratia sp. D1N4]
MKYIINEELIFDTEESTLSPVRNDTKLEMSTIAVRLLSEILTHSSGVTREHLLSAVWSDHGLKASNNNLNNHISLLRKHLEELAGLDDLIKTLPKKGFILNKNYRVDILGESVGEVRDVVSSTEVDKHRKFKLAFNKKIIATSLVFSFLFISSLYGKEIYHLLLEPSAEKIYTYKQCELRTLQEVPENKKKKIISIVIDTIKNNDIDCDNDNYDVFFYLSGKEQRKNEFKMFSLCRNGGDGYYSYCYSIRMV